MNMNNAENKYEDLKKVFNEFNIKDYTKKGSPTNQDIVNYNFLPKSDVKDVNPYLYKFKNQLLNIFTLNNRGVEINLLLQLHMMVLANTSDDVRLILFRLPRQNDKNFNESKNREMINKSKSFRDGVSNIVRSEWLIAFYNGIPIEIQRAFLEAVMDLKKEQSISNYLDKIGCKYEIKASYKMNSIYFEEIASSTKPYMLENDRVGDVINILSSNKKYILYIDDKCSIRLYRDSTFKLEVNLNFPIEEKDNENLGGLLSNVDIMRVVNYDVILDAVTANTLLTYFLDNDQEINQEGINFLINILNVYPTTEG